MSNSGVNVHGLIGHSVSHGYRKVVDQFSPVPARGVAVGSLVGGLAVGNRDVFKGPVGKQRSMNAARRRCRCRFAIGRRSFFLRRAETELGVGGELLGQLGGPAQAHQASSIAHPALACVYDHMHLLVLFQRQRLSRSQQAALISSLTL